MFIFSDLSIYPIDSANSLGPEFCLPGPGDLEVVRGERGVGSREERAPGCKWRMGFGDLGAKRSVFTQSQEGDRPTGLAWAKEEGIQTARNPC